MPLYQNNIPTQNNKLQYDMPILRSKLAGVLANNADMVIGVIGDSHNAASGVGSGTGYLWTNRFKYAPMHVAARLLRASGYPTSYDGYFGQRGEIVGLPVYDPLWTMTGTWTYNNGGNKALGNGVLRCTAAGTATRNTEYPWNACDVWINAATLTSGVIELSAVGATPVSYDFSGKTLAMTKLTITKSAVDLNPLVITCTTPMTTTGFDAIGISAVDFRDTTQSRIRVHNHAVGGAGMSVHLSTTSPVTSCFPAYQTLGMDVIILESYINEINSATPLATWLDYYTTFLNTMKTVNRDVIVYFGFPANKSWVLDGTIDTWYAALKNLLDARQINLIDLRSIYGTTYAECLARGFIFDDIHPNKTALSIKATKFSENLLSSRT